MGYGIPARRYSMKKQIISLITAIMCLALVGCSIPKYSEEEYNSASDTAYQEGYDKGHEDGYSEGKSDGYDEGKDVGYKEGYDEGKSDVSASNNTSSTTSDSTDSSDKPGSNAVFVTPSGSKYHRSWCRYVSSKTNLSYYDSASEAESAGYDACSVCF